MTEFKPGPLVSEATALPTLPHPQTFSQIKIDLEGKERCDRFPTNELNSCFELFRESSASSIG